VYFELWPVIPLYVMAAVAEKQCKALKRP